LQVTNQSGGSELRILKLVSSNLNNYPNLHKLKIINILLLRKIQKLHTIRKYIQHGRTLTSSAIMAISDELLVGTGALLAIWYDWKNINKGNIKTQRQWIIALINKVHTIPSLLRIDSASTSNLSWNFNNRFIHTKSQLDHKIITDLKPFLCDRLNYDPLLALIQIETKAAKNLRSTYWEHNSNRNNLI
jgi:hypothetical protein